MRDQFYDNPQDVLRIARGLSYFEPWNARGYRTCEVYQPRNIRERIERILGLRITRWDESPDDGNGVFYLSAGRGELSETPEVHYDEPEDDVTVVIYLTPDLPYDCGTSLWRHRATGLDRAPTSVDARRLGVGLGKLRTILDRDARSRQRWIETDRAGYRSNRLVAYPSGVLHSATRHYGRSTLDGRIYQTFRVGVDWRSSRMHS